MKLYLLIVISLGILLVACSKPGNAAPEFEDAVENEMGFVTAVATKGSPTSTESFKEMAVFCFATERKPWSEVASTAQANRMYNMIVNQIDNVWVYNPPMKWGGNLGDRFTFFGYAPYARKKLNNDVNPGGNNVTLDVVVGDTGNETPKPGVPKLFYETMDMVNAHVDLLIAAPLLDQNASSRDVAMTYNHKLAKVSFKGFISAPNSSIQSITLKGLKYKAEILLDGSPWTNVSSETKNFTLELFGAPISLDKTKPSEFTEPGNHFFVLPQDVTGLTMEIHYAIVSRSLTKTYTFPADANSNWTMGKSTTYTIDFGGEPNSDLIVTGATMKEWTTSGTIDIETEK